MPYRLLHLTPIDLCCFYLITIFRQFKISDETRTFSLKHEMLSSAFFFFHFFLCATIKLEWTAKIILNIISCDVCLLFHLLSFVSLISRHIMYTCIHAHTSRPSRRQSTLAHPWRAGSSCGFNRACWWNFQPANERPHWNYTSCKSHEIKRTPIVNNRCSLSRRIKRRCYVLGYLPVCANFDV